VYAHESEDYDHDAWFSAYTPKEEDGCYIDDVSMTDAMNKVGLIYNRIVVAYLITLYLILTYTYT
jgi:hypothetical protein